MTTRLQAHLGELSQHLQSRGHQVGWAEPSPGNPRTLLFNLAGRDAAGPLWLELCFLEGIEEQLDKADILQCFLPILTSIAVSQHDSLCRMIARINVKLPLVGFGFLEEQGLLFFKHDVLLPRQGTGRNDVVEQAVSLIGYQIATVAEPLISVGAKRKTESEALEGSRFSHFL